MNGTILHADPELEADVKGSDEIMLVFEDGYETAIGKHYEYSDARDFLLTRLAKIGSIKLAYELGVATIDELTEWLIDSDEINDDLTQIVYENYNGIYGNELG